MINQNIPNANVFIQQLLNAQSFFSCCFFFKHETLIESRFDMYYYYLLFVSNAFIQHKTWIYFFD